MAVTENVAEDPVVTVRLEGCAVIVGAVAAGGDRQDLHERIRVHSQAAARQVKESGEENDLIGRLAGDPAFSQVDLTATLNPVDFVGRAPEQVDAFIRDVVNPIRARYADALQVAAEQVRV